MSHATTLLALQSCDTQLLKTVGELEALPELKELEAIAHKRHDLLTKRDKLCAIAEETQKKNTQFEQQEEELVSKLAELAASLDQTSDYRMTESISRNMSSLTKRQEELAQKQEELLERQIKADNLYAKLQAILAELEQKTEKLTKICEQKREQLESKIEDLRQKRTRFTERLDPKVLRRYEILLTEKGGVAVACLEDGCCSACHMAVSTGQLERIKAAGNLAACPHCQRLFIFDSGE